MKPETKTAHTATPWIADEFDGRIYIVPESDPMLYIAEMIDPASDPEGKYPKEKERQANSDYICRAVNAHEELVKALEYILDHTPDLHPELKGRAMQALAKAEGK